jgi:SAM-dependent methyltransferase/methyltransferase-like protein
METWDEEATAYDKVLYPSGLFPQTHPDRLATTAYLRGMFPNPIEHCRVLELGCGAANNLLSMAFQLPGSDFVGVDLGRIPIAAGQAAVSELGLRNVTLEAMDICNPGFSKFGTFDFIIAHGVYSWVPPQVRECILRICRKMLAPNGIAYISYNAYPGCHFRDLVRHMMCFHTQKFDEVAEKAVQARALVKFVAESRKKSDYYTEAFRSQLGRLTRYDDRSLYHDDLNPAARPFYFHEFMEEAQRHDLKYVGEATLDTSDRALFTDQALQRMNELEGADEIVREQYKDFLCGTGFRQTLLCQKETLLSPAFLEDRIPELFVTCDYVPMSDPDNAGDAPFEIKSPEGGKVEIGHPVWRAAITYICSQWPGAVSFAQIMDELERRKESKFPKAKRADQAAVIVAALKQAYFAGVVSLRVRPPVVANRVSEQPAISQLARAQIRFGSSVSTQLHRSMKIPDAASRHFMLLLDGTRDLETLSSEMIDFTKTSQPEPDQASGEDANSFRTGVRERVKNNLYSLMRAGMLVS